MSFFLSVSHLRRWEFIKENKKVRKQDNTLSTKKAIKKKRKKTRSQPRMRSRKKITVKKKTLDQDSDQEKKKNFLFFSYFLVFLHKSSPMKIINRIEYYSSA